MDSPLSSRYARHESFARIGKGGQAHLRQARVLIVGCGALGSHLAETLVRAGVGRLTIIDRDVVEASNLQRQGLFREDDAIQSVPKAIAAERQLRVLNRDVVIRALVDDFNPDNAEELVEEHDLCLDASDNFETRFLLNDVCIKLGIPWIYAACVGSQAVAMPVLPNASACLACLLEDAPDQGSDTCDTIGIIMPAVLMAVAMSSTEALKILTAQSDECLRSLRKVDVWSGTSQTLSAAQPRPGCPVCGRREFAYLSGRKTSKAVKLCGRNSVQVLPAQQSALDLEEYAKRLAGNFVIRARNEFSLSLGDRDLELTIFRDGRCLVGGTTDLARAKAVVARVLG